MKKLLISSMKTNTAKVLAFISFGCLYVIAACLSLTIGRYHIQISTLWEALLGQSVPKSVSHVLFNLRLPRFLGATLAGGALAIAGLIYQNIFQNPLVSPDILGVSSGACVGAAFAIIGGLSGYYIALLSFSAGVISVAICLILSRATRNKGNLILVFTGIIIGKMMDAIVGLLKYFADTESKLGDIVNWQMGSMSRITMSQVYVMAAVIIPCAVLSLLFRWRLNLLAVGERDASALGVNVTVDRFILILVSTFMTAVSVCFCGVISWIGLIIPHISRWVIGSDNRKTIPMSAMIGSTFLVLSDLIARTATDYELPLGVITGLFGAPFFAYILIRKARKEK